MRTLADEQRAHIVEVLAAAGWRIAGSGGSAARLGLPRTTLLYRMRQLGIAPPKVSRKARAASASPEYRKLSL
jgi:formate hydrogenlyase transcriptional activator